MAVSWSAGFGAEPVWTPNSRGLYYRGKNRMHFAALTSGATLAVVRRDTLFADPNRRELLVVTYDGRLSRRAVAPDAEAERHELARVARGAQMAGAIAEGQRSDDLVEARTCYS